MYYGLYMSAAGAHAQSQRVEVLRMVELIAAQRRYEANIRLIQQHNTTTSALVGRMLRV